MHKPVRCFCLTQTSVGRLLATAIMSLALISGLGMLIADDSAHLATDIDQLIEKERQLRTSLREGIARAVQARDDGADEDVEQIERDNQQLEKEIEALEEQIEVAIYGLIQSLRNDLASADFKTREAATRQIEDLGPRAARVLMAQLRSEENPEVKSRLHRILKGYGLSFGEDLIVRQWGISATASSEYGNPEWSASQTTGEPDTFMAGDIPTAWAPAQMDGTREWLHIKFRHFVEVHQVRIHETCVPGAISKVEGISHDGEKIVLWEGVQPEATPPCWFEFKCDNQVTRELIIHLDTGRATGWNEIDAVELVGRLQFDLWNPGED